MKETLILPFLFVLAFVPTIGQEAVILRGQVLYRDVPVVSANVVNTVNQEATITNNDGEFAIKTKEGDELIFSSVQYKIKAVTITKDILKRNRLVVEVKEKVTELDEVVVGPENQESFLELKQEEFKQYDYERDKSTEIRNEITSKGEFTDGINFVNIFKAITKSNKNKGESSRPMKPSELLRQVYEDDFFVIDLKIPQDKIDDFLYYCDARLPSEALLKKDNEFELIEFLVNQSHDYLDQQ